MRRCTTCGEAYEDTVDMCPRDGTPLFAAEAGTPATEKKTAVASLEEVSDAITQWEGEESHADADSTNEYEPELDAGPPTVQATDAGPPTIQEPSSNAGGFRVIGGEDLEDQYDPTNVMEVDDREAFKREALRAAGIHIEPDGDDAEPEYLEDELEEEPAGLAETTNDPLPEPYGANFAAARAEPEPEPPAAPRRRDDFGTLPPGEGMIPALIEESDVFPEPIRNEPAVDDFGPIPGAAPPAQQGPAGFQPPSRQPAGAPQHGQGPRVPAPQGSVPNVQASIPSYQEYAPGPSDSASHTAEITIDFERPKKSSFGRIFVFFIAAVLLGAVTGATIYYFVLMPQQEASGTAEAASTPTQTEPTEQPPPVEEPVEEVEEPVEEMVIGDEPTSDAGEASVDAGPDMAEPTEEELAALEEEGRTLASSIKAVGEETASAIEEAQQEEAQNERRKKRRRTPRRRRPPKKEKTSSSDEDADIDIWGGGSSEKKEEPKKKDPPKKKEEPKKESDDSLDIW